MIGSPFYYDVLFDDGPGDVVFHDCMWSGICTCCIQLLHQDSYQFANESPDLKTEDSHCRAQINHAAPATATITTTSSASSQHQHQTQHQQLTSCAPASCRIGPENPAPISQAGARCASAGNTSNSSPDAGPHATNGSFNINNCRTCPDEPSSSSSITTQSASRQASCLTSPDNSSSLSSSASSSSASSPALAQAHSSSSLSPNRNSQSSSPKPIRRREHNDSERKRRDHLRNAFNFLRDQVPRFKTISKKPPRIQILHEATKYVQIVMKEAEELERRLSEERAKHELNMKLSMK